MHDKDVERLKEIIKIAHKLKWIYPKSMTGFPLSQASYPLMQLSEVKKCMLAMTDDSELNRMREWEKDMDKLNKVLFDKVQPKRT